MGYEVKKILAEHNIIEPREVGKDQLETNSNETIIVDDEDGRVRKKNFKTICETALQTHDQSSLGSGTLNILSIPHEGFPCRGSNSVSTHGRPEFIYNQTETETKVVAN